MFHLIEFKTIFDGGMALNNILDFVFVLIVLVFINWVVNFFIKRKAVTVTLLTASLVYIVAHLLVFDGLATFCLMVILLSILVGFFVNMAELRTYFANKASQKKNDKIVKKKSHEVEKIFDHTDMYKTINEAVLFFSKHKIGAIITFERKDRLDDIIKNGTRLECPVNYELLLTIFYPGTRLHDGAVVIKDDKIVAASVYYTPTTKALIGKYGSRHRAAIGISEICDAVTVVVSEETGRISIAYNGELESYNVDTFYNAFENIMSLTTSDTNE